MKPKDPFEFLPNALTEALSATFTEITDAVIEEIRERVPEYARPSNARYMHALHASVKHGLQSFIDRISNPQAGIEEVKEFYESVGAWEAEEGRTLDSFQSALRLAARTAWNALTNRATENLDSHELARLTDAMLVHIDDLSSFTVKGFEQAGTHRLNELKRRQARLVKLITTDPPVSMGALEGLSAACGWRLPERITIAVAHEDPGGQRANFPATPPGALSGRIDGVLTFAIPDADGPGHREFLERFFRCDRISVGPSVEIVDGARSLQWASEMQLLIRNGIVQAEGVAFCSDHLSTLLLFRDPELLDVLSRQHLAPLNRLAPAKRDRLAETLLAWLRSRRSPTTVARWLQLHPQTVRYRMRQLETIYGAKLRDPDALFELELVLRDWELRHNARHPRSRSDTGSE
ncbi:helix-turn-helix domain-containing protein [Streptomyces sp. NPDC020800]|uniref:PucR family transcriptional regulator n=1 Tax=Streptomyces sp. NPDC020800 TaxID=3365092 RepID=UPI0037B06572